MELRIPTPHQLREAYRRDLTVSFPEAELKPLRAIETMWEKGWYRPWCLFQGEEIVGECFLWAVEPGWALLDYLCVSPVQRNGGAGALLLQKMREKESGTIIFAESEAVERAPDPDMAKRRLGFYHRNAAQLADFDAQIFGVQYKLLYWADRTLPDRELMEHYDRVYRKSFLPEKYRAYVQIPWDRTQPPQPLVPWDE